MFSSLTIALFFIFFALSANFKVDKVSFIAADAISSMQHCMPHSYDCLFVDLFIGQCLPDAALQSEFLEQCKRAIKPGGLFLMNYIATDFIAWKYYQKRVQDVYPNLMIIENDINNQLGEKPWLVKDRMKDLVII